MVLICELEENHEGWRSDAGGYTWVLYPSLPDFDRFCAEHKISEEEAPAAFAA